MQALTNQEFKQFVDFLRVTGVVKNYRDFADKWGHSTGYVSDLFKGAKGVSEKITEDIREKFSPQFEEWMESRQNYFTYSSLFSSRADQTGNLKIVEELAKTAPHFVQESRTNSRAELAIKDSIIQSLSDSNENLKREVEDLRRQLNDSRSQILWLQALVDKLSK